MRAAAAIALLLALAACARPHRFEVGAYVCVYGSPARVIEYDDEFTARVARADGEQSLTVSARDLQECGQ